jgi:hypothetical protein
MTQTAVQKQCNHCQKTFEPKDVRNIYCSKTCKVYASKARKKKSEEEEMIINNEPDEENNMDAVGTTDAIENASSQKSVNDIDMSKIRPSEIVNFDKEKDVELWLDWVKKLNAHLKVNNKINILATGKICTVPDFMLRDDGLSFFGMFNIHAIPFYGISYSINNKYKTMGILYALCVDGRIANDIKILYACGISTQSINIPRIIAECEYNEGLGSNDNFVLLRANSTAEIMKELENDEYFFLIIDSFDDFNMKRPTIENIMVKYPLLSIIILNTNRIASIEPLFSEINETTYAYGHNGNTDMKKHKRIGVENSIYSALKKKDEDIEYYE